MEKYLKEHCLTPEVIEKYGLKVSQNEIEIPVCDEAGLPLFSKYRMLNNPSGIKYRYDKGSKMALYNAHRITKDTTDVWVVEGETEAIALSETLYGLKKSVAVSSTGGAGSWNVKWNELLEGKNVHILLDNDMPGYRGSFRLWKKIGCADVFKVNDGKDICDILSSGKMVKAVSYIQQKFCELPTLKSMEGFFRFLEEIPFRFSKLSDSDKKFISVFMTEMSKIYQEKKSYNKKKKMPVLPDNRKADISELKRIPITNFIEFHRGVAPCIFHHDHNPSMHYNDFNSPFPNTVKCYACGKFADIIDVVMQLNNVDFKGALEYLKGR